MINTQYYKNKRKNTYNNIIVLCEKQYKNPLKQLNIYDQQYEKILIELKEKTKEKYEMKKLKYFLGRGQFPKTGDIEIDTIKINTITDKKNYMNYHKDREIHHHHIFCTII